MKSLTFFNNKGGVGKTTLTFNIAHMLARKGRRVVVLDYDPQCDISTMFLGDQALAEIWSEEAEGGTARQGRTVASCIPNLRKDEDEYYEDDIFAPSLLPVADDLWLLPGHLKLGRLDLNLNSFLPRPLESYAEVFTTFKQLSNLAAAQVDADVVLIDVGPSLAALSRAALVCCDAVVIPLAPDPFSLQGLANLGAALRKWHRDREATAGMVARFNPYKPPESLLHPIGYIVQQHLARADRSPSGDLRWAAQIPFYFHRYMLDEDDADRGLAIEDDEQCIAFIKHFASLVPFAQIARKPIFDLRQADGIGAGHLQVVARAQREFSELVDKLVGRLDALPESRAERQPRAIEEPSALPESHAEREPRAIEEPARQLRLIKTR